MNSGRQIQVWDVAILSSRGTKGGIPITENLPDLPQGVEFAGGKAHSRDGIATQGSALEHMDPFSDFEHLRQAFTVGQRWAVRPDRLRALRDGGLIGEVSLDRFGAQGAVGSHLENLQRREGFKGFNQQAVSKIIREVNPEREAMR